MKLVPVIVTSVPLEPVIGLNDDTLGRNENSAIKVELLPALLVTTTAQVWVLGGDWTCGALVQIKRSVATVND
jgi:hypothetical protein